MTLGERLFAAALATGAHPFHEAGVSWEHCSEATKARWEACAVMIDAATRADVVGQLGTMALNTRSAHEYQTLRQAADRVEAGRQ